MMIRRLVILFCILLATLGLFSISLVIAQNTPPSPISPEAEVEESITREQTDTPTRIVQTGSANPVTDTLFVGVDNIEVPAYLIDPTTNISDTAFVGAEVWGAAYDSENDRVLFMDGAILFEWSVGGAVNELGLIRDPEDKAIALVGLGHYNGILYGTRNNSNEAVYAIDLNTMEATVHIDYDDDENKIDGFSIDPDTGIFYVTNDKSFSLEQLNPDGTLTHIAPYPPRQEDIDGLAIGGGNAYLITDEPGDIYIFNLNIMTYTGTLMNPWTTSELFVGAAWVEKSTKLNYLPSIIHE